MKERTIRIIVLSVVFVLAIIVFSFWTNRGNVDITADMSAATLPTVSFKVAGKQANMLVGHKRNMSPAAVRDTISVYDDAEKLEMTIHHNMESVDAISYEIYSLDGEEKLYQADVDKVKETVKLKMGAELSEGQEALLKVTLHCGDTSLYYYTRVIKEQDYHVEDCVKYIEELHTNILKKQNDDAVKKVMESNSQGDNTTLQHVTIHSDLQHIMWGGLKPKLVHELQYEIKEVKKAYTSVLLRYQVECAGDNNGKELYNVKEFFKVAYGKERAYLLEYDRTMEEVFDTSNVTLSSKGVLLGIAKDDTPYKVNKEGTIVSFVQANELWNYQREEDALSLVFSFASAEKYDPRNWTDQHAIKILSMENDGNMTFSVSGYMNRGEHEGESGIAIYYYYASKNYVEEIAFIPSTQSQAVLEKTLGESAYYNQMQDVLYVLSNGTLRKIVMTDNTSSVLVEGLEKGQYVASSDGHLFAYQKQADGNDVTEVWDFAKDSIKALSATDGEVVVPLGFVENDFVYGISKVENAGLDTSGATVQAMHKIEIRNEKNKVIKTYEQPNVYVLRAVVDNNMITLKQGVKEGALFKEISEDYITNNENSSGEQVVLKSYWTDLKETQYRLTFAKSIHDTKAKVLHPKQVIQERVTVLELENEANEEFFYVYGHGRQAGAFEEAGDAIALAEKLSGVVISPGQNYVWEADNRVAWYRNFNVSPFVLKDGENHLAACVRKVLGYEGKSADVVTELQLKTPEQILSEQLGTEAVRFRGCSVKDMFYLIDKGVPVIGLKDSTNAILFIGYDAKTATYIDPTNGGTYASSIEKLDEMLKGSGNTFLGYVR